MHTTSDQVFATKAWSPSWKLKLALKFKSFYQNSFHHTSPRLVRLPRLGFGNRTSFFLCKTMVIVLFNQYPFAEYLRLFYYLELGLTYFYYHYKIMPGLMTHNALQLTYWSLKSWLQVFHMMQLIWNLYFHSIRRLTPTNVFFQILSDQYLIVIPLNLWHFMKQEITRIRS